MFLSCLHITKKHDGEDDLYFSKSDFCFPTIGLDKIEFLQSHENQEIYQKAFELIEHYFGVEEDDPQLVPSVDDSQQQYIFQPTEAPMEGFQLWARIFKTIRESRLHYSFQVVERDVGRRPFVLKSNYSWFIREVLMLCSGRESCGLTPCSTLCCFLWGLYVKHILSSAADLSLLHKVKHIFFFFPVFDLKWTCSIWNALELNALLFCSFCAGGRGAESSVHLFFFLFDDKYSAI